MASSIALSFAASRSFAAVAIVAGAEFLGAGMLRQFLLADDWRAVVGLLLAFAAALVAMQRLPAIEARIEAAFSRHQTLATVLGMAIVFAFPFVLQDNTYALHLCVVAQLYTVLALALNFQLGSANIPNFATGASYGIGAYTSALLALHWDVSFWLALPAAAIVATAFGFLLGLPTMRTRDSYLALVTIAFGVVIHQLLNNLEFTGGPNGLVGIPAPQLFGHSFAAPLVVFGHELPPQANFYYLSAALVGIAILFADRLHNSRIGLAWNALRTDELAARCQGINTTWYKMLAFAVDSFLAGFAGTIYAFYIGFISPDDFTFLVSVTIMTMVIAGGMDNILGVIVGAFLLTLLPEKLRAFSDYRILFFGATVIAFLMIRPQGIFPQRLRRYEG
ncbi:MAG: branched-chain amino acid ABC transporter permease [Rhodospirillales bacterium]|nr:branched-chain amino acid ABC transporter permease [Rhodospirillales bacterium]